MKSSLTIFALAALLLGPGCAGDDTTALNGPLASGGNGGGDATKPGTASGGAKGTTSPNDPADKPAAGCTTPPPANDPVKCWAEENPAGTCKVCVDANGKEVVRSCAQPANDLKCWVEETKDATCKVCVDPATGKEVARACSGTNPAGGEQKCYEETGKNGEVCKVCVDASGKEMRACAGTTDPANVKCYEEKGKEGQICKVCVDPATGKEVARGCSGPATPPGPSVKCEEFQAGDTVCKVCYDANGTPVSKECAVR